MTRPTALTATAILSLSALICEARSAGPDVIVGFIDGGRQFSVLPTGELAITAGTNSCNGGTQPINWRALPDAEHPVISLNLYQEKNGQFKQLASTWVKHGFFATNESACSSIAGIPACSPAAAGNALGPGCSDLYGDYLNSNADYLGPRGRINPTTGTFDASLAPVPLEGSPEIADDEKILIVDPVSLSDPGARLFMEAHYIASDDASAGNSRNNVTYREVAPHDGSATFVARYLSPEVRGDPAVKAWEGALVSERSGTEGGITTTLIAASKATPLPNGEFRYDYVLYNMNSDLGLQSLTIRGVKDAREQTFSGVIARGEPWNSDPWTSTLEPDGLVWATQPFASNPAANALRWGNTYSFSFVSKGSPTTGTATALKYKPAKDDDKNFEEFEVFVPFQ